MASGPANIGEIFHLLETSDTSTNFKRIVHENLTVFKEIWLIPLLVDYYYGTHSSNVIELLSGLRETHAKVLIEKLQDGVKAQETRLPALQLILHLVYRELPWCHQLLEMPIFSSIIKCLKSEHDVPILMTSLMIVVILLPSAPVSMGRMLTQIFDVFGRLTLFCVRKPANTPELFLLHLQVSLYSLFNRLYGMFPCTFLDFISHFFSQKENLMAYQEVVMVTSIKILFHQPMLERVRLHPNIVMSKGQNEMDTNRWKNQETQDIIVNCSKLCLDLIEGSVEESHCPIYHSVQEVLTKSTMYTSSIEDTTGSKSMPVPVMSSSKDVHSDTQFLMSWTEQTVVVGESPSVLIGLSTPPPSQRTTPACSFLEPHGTTGATPEGASRQATPLCAGAEEAEKVDNADLTIFTQRAVTTPLSSNRSSVSHNLSKLCDSGKKQQQQQQPQLVVVTPKVTATPHTTPVSSHVAGSTAHSGGPLFSSPINTIPISIGADAVSPLKSQPSAFVSPRRQQSKSPAIRSIQFTSQTESCDKGDDSPRLRAGGTEIHMNLDKQFEQSSAEGEAQNTKDVSTSSPMPMDDASTEKVVDGPGNIEGGGNPEPEDQEVEEINEREDQFNVEGSPTSSISTQTSQAEVTAESVRQFMKKVNRIRFNSLTSNSSSEHDAHNKAAAAAGGIGVQVQRRPRSCPPLKRLAHRWSVERKEYHSMSGKHPKQRSGQSHHRQHRRRSRKSWMTTEEGKRAVEEEENDEDKTEEISEESGEDFSSSSNGTATIPKITISKSDGTDSKSRPAGRRNISTQNASTQVVPAFPMEIHPAFQMFLAPSKMAVCSKCQHDVVLVSSHQSTTITADPDPTTSSSTPPGGKVTTIKGTEVSLFNALSPPELLDRHLKLGCELHAKELNKIPLTSKDTVNWTHFGGVPPADEVNILKGQILLMQAQLMYERHKRSNHAKRNRRLLRRIAHEAKLEEQQKTLNDQIGLLEQEVQQLTISIKLVQEDNRRLRLAQESDEYSKLVQYRSSIQENKDLRANSSGLKKLLLTQREDYDRLQKKLEHVEHVNLDQDRDLKNCKEQLANTEKLKGQVFKLQKELLLMQELHLKYQEKLHHNFPSHHQRNEQDLLVSSVRQQLAELEKENRKKSTLLEAYQASAVESENILKRKDNDILKLKHDLNKKRSEHVEQIKSLEARITSLIHTNQLLETRVVELMCKVDQQAHKATLEALRENEARDRPLQGCMQKQSLENPTKLNEDDDSDNQNNNNNNDEEGGDMGMGGGRWREDKEDDKDDDNDGVGGGGNVGGVLKSKSTSCSSGGSGNVSVVLAKEEVSAEGSSFFQADDKNGNVSGVRNPALSARSRAETDAYFDSGAASRSSFRVDSDVSMRSVSEDSVVTGDSGLWPKT